MAQKIRVHSVNNANVYANGKNLLGRVKKVDNPELVYKQNEYSALGMVGTTDVFAGVEAIKMSLTWNSFYADVLGEVADPTSAIQLQIRSSVQVRASTGLVEEQPLVTFLTVHANNLPSASFEQHSNPELESKFTVTYYRMELAGTVICELDVLSNIFKVRGRDILARYRRNLGA
jgi:P2 family phage contractile tail tube protein